MQRGKKKISGMYPEMIKKLKDNEKGDFINSNGSM